MILVRGNQLACNGKTYRCAIGKGGFAVNKKEGDHCTPLGTFPLRECWYRSDRVGAPETGLPLKAIHEDDGWCDDPKSVEYNRHIITPPPAGGRLGGGHAGEDSVPYAPTTLPLRRRGYEHLWRDDHRYDLIVPLGYNDAPAVPGKGSAIFLHVAAPDYAGTEGCVALAQADLLEVLALCDTGTMMEIREE